MIEEYVRKILEIGCNIKENDNLVIYSKFDVSDFKEILFRIKDEYKINQIVFMEDNSKEIYDFLMNNPTEEQIKKFVVKYPTIHQKEKVKIINILDGDYNGYYNKLGYELIDLYKIYCNYNLEFNKEIYDLFDTNMMIVIDWPTDDWAINLFGNTGNKNTLWNLLVNTIPDVSSLNDEVKKLKQIRGYLNSLSIRQLYFNSNNGTDFRIGLSKYSKWFSEPSVKNGIEYFENFPSYEIFTSPDYNAVDGKGVIAKPSYFSGLKVKNAELKFLKGKCISCESDSQRWDKVVLNKKNNLNRVGEIALVSRDTPLAKMNRTFNSLLLDENTGCHLGLGNSIIDCININYDWIQRKGLKHYNFNSSAYHYDLIFGNDSIIVEAKTKDKKKVLLMENGVWKI